VGYLLLFVFLWWAWTLAPIVNTVIPGGTPLNRRVLYVLGIDIVGLVAIARYFRTWSLLWQVPLQALAAVMLFKGVGSVVRLIFDRPHALIEPTGLWYVGIALCGVIAALLMKTLQVRFLGGHYRHLTTRWSGP
jgi:hypothetical protein